MTKKELFIVEGKSAGHALEFAMDKKHQCVHALQGKLINVRTKSRTAVAKNLECQKLMATLGCDFTTEYAVETLPYSHVLILMDPDIDGAHSAALALSFFAEHCKPIIAGGLLSVVKPPMFRVTAPDIDAAYAWSEEELRQVLQKYSSNNSVQTTRFKGVAQFSANECYELLLSNRTRRQYALHDDI